ncbi:hypothetical protein GGQ85_003651 [Nitrobacter vulgaris]|uniref:hypothetical protein n=1 Tax=Nitrobacter vulgaris TaxID=29421 RepID=UPI0028603D03|nr:hypothetical protein [Nitrobacter vulgaris]MDR6305925.1 hypothetical protein [Nitrobacter vulgaris]
MDLSRIREELCQMRRQILRQRKEIRNLQLAGVPTAAAEELMARMKSRVVELREERVRQSEEQRRQKPAMANVRKRPFERR